MRASILTAAPTGLGLGKYCGPHTASFVFLILIPNIRREEIGIIPS